jgi:tetrahydromethanopterin S-methyltransferase subunit G
VAPRFGLVVGLSLSLVIGAVLVRALRQADVDQSFALLGVGSLLLSPLGWNYYLVSCLMPTVAALRRRPTQWLWLLGAAAVCPFGSIVGRRYGVLGTLTIGQLAFAVDVALLVLLRHSVRSAPQRM